MRSPTRRRTLAVLSTTALIVASLTTMGAAQSDGSAGAASGADPDEKHCPDHRDNPKAEGEGAHTLEVDGETITVDIDGAQVHFSDEDGDPITVEFCIKSAQEQSGEQIGSSGTSPATNRHGEPQDISYVVVYRIVDEEPDCPGAAGGISLAHADGSDDPATNEPGDPHAVTATVTGEDGGPCPDVNVRFEVDGDGDPTPSEGNRTTDDDGEADFEFNNDEEGTNTVTACTNADGSLPDDCATADHSDSLTKIWQDDGPPPPQCPGAAGGISLAHADGSDDPATNEPGDPHAVTATVTGEDGGPCPDVNVRFEVDGDGDPTPSEGNRTTDDDGEADFEFNNDEEGTNTVTACTNADGSLPDDCADADHSDSLTKIWQGVDLAFCRARTVNLLDEALILFEANEDGSDCVTEDGSLLNAGQVRLARTETDRDATSANSEVAGLGGQDGDPGGVSLLGTGADCEGQEAYLVLITDGGGEELLRLAGDGDPLPNLALDPGNGIFLTEEDPETGKAQVLALRLQDGELVVVSESQATC